jgi:hypothetical protein
MEKINKMNGTTWTVDELEFIKNYYGTTSAQSIAERLQRSIHSVKLQANKLKLKSKRQIEIERKKALLLELIISGNRNTLSLSSKSGLTRQTCQKAVYIYESIHGRKIDRVREEPKPYILSEKEIFDSINPVYDLQDLKGWEKFQLKQDTPKGCECPKLHTKQLNTYKL